MAEREVRLVKCRVLAAVIFCTGVACSQAVRLQAGFGSAPAVPAATAVVLRQLAGRASVVFAGRVVSIDRHEPLGYVDIVFSVETAVRGCRSNSTYALREWIGLWLGWPDRYRVGQRRLMLLAAPGPSGIAAPVGGMAGMIPVVGTRNPPLLHDAFDVPADTLGERSADGVDLRWVEIQAQRATVSSSNATTVSGRRIFWHGPILKNPEPSSTSPKSPSLSAVLALLSESSAGGSLAR